MPQVVQQQHTLGKPVSLSGIGLHSGNKVAMTFHPAPVNSGIRFRRVDLEGHPEIEARIENVTETARSTTLSKGNIRIHTVEHVMSAFAGLEVDNAIVELDANEPPIADGSAREYRRMIEQAGRENQKEKREPYCISEPLEWGSGGTHVSVFPHPELRITCTSSDQKGRFTQMYSLGINPAAWEREIADARTFCFFEEIDYLIRNGLIKGGSLENAVVIRDDAVLTTEPLRFADEFVRHKILDVVGDLALLGRPISGHVVTVCPSHTSNCELVRLIAAQINKPVVAARTFSPPPVSGNGDAGSKSGGRALGKGALDVMQVMKLLPHRYPFMMVDRVTRIEGTRITAVKNVSINEPFFQGHFPGHPIMPGVLQLEAIAQAAGILMLQQAENAGKLAYFMSAENVKWRRPVRPGDILVIEVELTKTRGKIGRAKGVCTVDEEIVSEGDVTFMLTDG